MTDIATGTRVLWHPLPTMDVECYIAREILPGRAYDLTVRFPTIYRLKGRTHTLARGDTVKATPASFTVLA